MDAEVNQFLVIALCLVRCLVPVVILLGVSYLLRRLGWLPTEPPEDEVDDDDTSS